MSYMKDARSGAVGNTRLQAKYGAGSTPPRQHYASGGRVAGGETPGPGEEIAASGKGAKRSFAKSAKMRKRADGGRLSEDSQQKARAAEAKDSGPISPKTLGAGATLGAGVVTLGKAFSRKTPLGRALTSGTGGLLTYGGAKLAKDDYERMREGTAAGKEARDIRAMKPVEGEEDRKKGGRVKRADGGWAGEGDSGRAKKEQAAAETQRADDRDTEATAQSISSGTIGAAGADALKRGRVGRGAAGMALLAGGQLGALYNSRRAREARKAAADANREGDKAEGRKRGGRTG